MVRLLDKQREMDLLNDVFELLWENMQQIVPSDHGYEEEKRRWLANVAPALKKDPRQLALIFDGEALVGFCQYYCNGGIFMIEELQLRRGFRAGGYTVTLWRFLSRCLSADVRYVEAYADVRNADSRHLMEKVGMELIEKTGDFLHFRGDISRIPIF